MFSARNSELQTPFPHAHYGFDVSVNAEDRECVAKGMAARTRPGKPINRPSIALILGVIDALRDGPKGEKEIKDFVLGRFRDQGLKISSRLVLSGECLLELDENNKLDRIKPLAC